MPRAGYFCTLFDKPPPNPGRFTNPIQRQAEITNSILSEARRISGSDIQSLEELSLYVITNPSFSDDIVDIYKK